jgi:cytidylate kinase
MEIIIGGPPGVGTTTVAKAISEKLNLRYISTGELFRQIAEQKGLEVEKLSETASKEVDFEVDSITLDELEKGDVVIESELASWAKTFAKALGKTFDKKLINIWLTASLEARAQRILTDEKARTAETYSSLEQVKEKIIKRFEEDKRRYKEYYGIDLDDMSIYDLVIDTENIGSEEVINKIIEFIE